jgi:hypothetical protein
MPENAAIYIGDPSVIGTKLFRQLEGVRSHTGLSQDESATGLGFELAAGRIAMNFMSEGIMAEHLQGFCGYAEHVISNKDRLIYAVSRIQHTRLVLGCVIEPGFDDEGKIQDFLFQFNSLVNGLLFLGDTIFDYDGEALGGPLAEQS